MQPRTLQAPVQLGRPVHAAAPPGYQGVAPVSLGGPPRPQPQPCVWRAAAPGPVLFPAPASPAPLSGPALVTADLARKQQTTPDQRDQAYRSLIQSLAAWGVLEDLPLDNGVLHVNAPFCHDFFEAPLLLPFLAARFLRPGSGVRKLALRGCDVRSQDFWWPAWEQWAQRSFEGRVSLELRQQDLVVQQQAPAGLTLACHPEVTNGGPWLPILRHVLRSRALHGRCVFATFYRHEAEALEQAAAEICRAEGAAVEIRENPFYAGKSLDEVGTFHRFAVILAPNGLSGQNGVCRTN
ncbi:unnamed protein product [Effrenium voratum]|nr:unnamed protein product [Effrenium voratum]